MVRNARSPIIDPLDPRADMEAWQNTAKGTVGVWHYAGAYGETRIELVPGGGTFHVTAAERRLNMEKALNEKLCAFRNGTLVPVRTDEVDDTDEVTANPVALSDDDVIRLVGGHHKTLAKAVAEIDNPITLNRLLDAAEAEGVTLGKIKSIQTRLEEVTGGPPAVETVESAAPDVADPAAIPEPEKVDIYDDAAFAGN